MATKPKKPRIDDWGDYDDDEKAVAPKEYLYNPDPSWRARQKEWAEGIAETLADIVFSMAKDGIDKETIAKYFGVSRQQLQMFDTQFEMGRADLQARIASKTVDMALTAKMPTPIIWAGKVFNQYNETTQVEATDDSGVSFNVNIVRGNKETDYSSDSEGSSTGYH